jgi:Flp pilus assembly protein TadD
MGIHRTALIKPPSADLCKFQTRLVRIGAATWLAGCLLLGAGVAPAANGSYEVWSSESYTLTPRESFQLRVAYEQIQVRSWKLVVDGGDQNCDLHVRRSKDGALLYQQNDHQHHEVTVPWGVGEEVSIVVTNREVKGAFVVSLLGPPRDQIHASYGYHVNRALEKFAAGQRLAAEDECRLALVADPSDGVAKVLLAGFLRDRHYLDRATALIDDALAGELPGTMQEIAESMRQELIKLRAPLPLPVRRGVDDAENLLISGQPEPALAVCTKLLEGDLELDAHARSRLLMLQGQALDQLGRNFESVDAFTHALQLNRTKAQEGIIYFHMGRLFLKMDNLPQAQGAFTMALQNGLPSGLDVQARESLQSIETRRNSER